MSDRVFFLRRTILAIAVAAALPLLAQRAQANPVDPTIIADSAFFQSIGKMRPVSNSPGAIFHWCAFSIGADETTRLIPQHAASSILDRVVRLVNLVNPELHYELSAPGVLDIGAGGTWLLDPYDFTIGSTTTHYGNAEESREREEAGGAYHAATAAYRVDRRGSEQRATPQCARAAILSAFPLSSPPQQTRYMPPPGFYDHRPPAGVVR